MIAVKVLAIYMLVSSSYVVSCVVGFEGCSDGWGSWLYIVVVVVGGSCVGLRVSLR